MGTYAAQTTVTPERSRAEIEKTLMRYGASAFMYGWDGRRAAIGFQAHGRQVRLTLTMPAQPDESARPGKKVATRATYEQTIRQRWRALALIVKAKLEAVDSGIVTFDEEFLAHFVLPDGDSVYESIRPGLEEAYATGRVGPLIPSLAGSPAGSGNALTTGRG